MNSPVSLQNEARKILLVAGNSNELPEATSYLYQKRVNVFDKIGLQPCKVRYFCI